MLRIGDFARLGGVTVRALRHYEAEGLLASDAGVHALVERLRQQRTRLAEEIERQTSRLRRLEALQRAIGSDPSAPELSVRVRAIPDVRALTIRTRVRSQGAPIAALFEEAETRAARDRVDRSPFLLFHGALDVEACVPVRSASRGPGVRLVAGAPLAGTVTYAGAYTQTRSLHARMLRWLERSGMRASGPLREVYHRFGADQRGYRLPAMRLAAGPEQFVTELQVPAEEAE